MDDKAYNLTPAKIVEHKNILIVEDNNQLCDSLAKYFSNFNEVTSCYNLDEALKAIQENNYDIILLDLILPDGNGLNLMDHIGQTPVIILSNLGTDANILEGFQAGAADYIVKPSSPQVIETRMSLRLLPDSKATISSHGLTINLSKRTTFYLHQPINLTSSEFNILAFLIENSGQFYTANEIYEQVWKMPHLNSTTIKAHLSNLRKKMLAVSADCASLIISEFGKGYAFVGD